MTSDTPTTDTEPKKPSDALTPVEGPVDPPVPARVPDDAPVKADASPKDALEDAPTTSAPRTPHATEGAPPNTDDAKLGDADTLPARVVDPAVVEADTVPADVVLVAVAAKEEALPAIEEPGAAPEPVIAPVVETRGQWPLLLAAALPILFFFLLPPLTKSGLWDPFELNVADPSRRLALNLFGADSLSLAVTDNSLPHLNDLGRPQLPFTSVALGFKLFGLHVWAGRAPLALCPAKAAMPTSR
jgi:hypothetical protein